MKSFVFFLFVGGLLWVVGVVLSRTDGTPSGADGSVRVEVEGVFLSPGSMSPVVVLSDREGGRSLPIWIGYLEAEAIRRRLAGETQPRPLTHDLLGNAVKRLGASVDRIVVTDLTEGTYFARVHLTTASDTLSLDARPSDAIALALGTGAPIFVSRLVLDAAGEDAPPGSDLTGGASPEEIGCGIWCQGLDTGLASALGVQSGILVADVPGEAAGVERGDVIVEIGGQPASDLGRVKELLAALGAGDELPARVMRRGAPVEITITCR